MLDPAARLEHLQHPPAADLVSHACVMCGVAFLAIAAFPDLCVAHPALRRAAWPLRTLWTAPMPGDDILEAQAGVQRRAEAIRAVRAVGGSLPWDADLIGQR